MQVTRDDLAEFERLLAKLRENPAAVDEEADLPAAEYARITYVTVALLIYVNVSMVISICTTGVEGNLSQIEYLVYPLCFTANCGLLVFGALDSEAAGRRAIKLLRGWLITLIIIIPPLYWTSGMHEDAVLLVFYMAINAIFYPWLLDSMRELLRTRYKGSLTTQAHFYTNRALKLGAFQIVLLVSAVAQGIDGADTFLRVYATFSFSMNLIIAWIYVIAIFDVCAVDGRAAAKLRLSPLQAAAVASVGGVAFSGLGGYVLSQRRPSKRAAHATVYSLLFFNFLCYIFVGRLVWVARRKAPDDSAASVQPVKDEGLEAGGVFDVPGA